MDARRSRRPRLGAIPPDWLVLVARAWLIDGNHNTSVAHVTKVLESAAARGSEEAEWLLAAMRRNAGDIPGDDWQAKWRWLADLLATDDSPRAQYYRGLALWGLKRREAGLALLRRSAESGFVPAFGELGCRIYLSDRRDEGIALLRKGTEQGDPEAMYQLGHRDDSRGFELHSEAAKHGHALSMWNLAFSFGHRVLALDAALLFARYALLSGNHSPIAAELRPVIRRFYKAKTAADAQLLFVVGRELEGYDQFWDAGRHVSDQSARCVNVYLTITYRARVAALQTISALRQRGIPRDVALLVGRRVFATRDDAFAWLLTGTPLLKRSRQNL